MRLSKFKNTRPLSRRLMAKKRKDPDGTAKNCWTLGVQYRTVCEWVGRVWRGEIVFSLYLVFSFQQRQVVVI